MVPVELLNTAFVSQKSLLLIILELALDLIEKIVEVSHLSNNFFGLKRRISSPILLYNFSKCKIAPALFLHPLTVGYDFASFL